MKLWRISLIAKKVHSVFFRTSTGMFEKVSFVDIRYHLWLVLSSLCSLTSMLQKGF